MFIRILSLEVSCEESKHSGIPFIDVELFFRVEGEGPEYEALLSEVKKYAQGYHLSFTVGNIESYLEWVNGQGLWEDSDDSPCMDKAWVIADKEFQECPEANTFLFSECIADSSVTRAALSELKFFQENGYLPSKYRHDDSYIVLSLILTLSRFWD